MLVAAPVQKGGLTQSGDFAHGPLGTGIPVDECNVDVTPIDHRKDALMALTE